MTISRRRFITISAAAMGVGLPSHARTWRGVALGADVSITLHSQQSNTDQIITRAVSHIRRLEGEFSIYQPQSRISSLNHTGKTANSFDFNALLNEVNEIHALTNGLFDPTIQPLWQAYANDPNLPVDAEKQALLRVGWRHVQNTPDHLRFARAGMAMTLNGIAQGFVTDQISTLLHNAGFPDATVNIGEYRTGTNPVKIAIGGSDSAITLSNAAIATSAPSALMLNGHTGHILHPKRGAIPSVWQSVSVVAKRASIADGISTALCLADDLSLAQRLVQTGVIQRCILIDKHGKITTLVG
ncbi:hypothetical protein BFP76_05465 [Amylibacter kogurei]|uniref:FAD:protein FMN transferase n=1 Tax=Paramylibacter kogurei TaxID=1889778 RepID=A0A2G5K6X4_9RHOB|nr:FAD:protein FMN transferase [Amylibacter kogurei]PIB24630.1 hypothetical protein BFP76_05465 [Amylibacter kogurei]